MNPVLLKPTSGRHAQVVVRGVAAGITDAADWQPPMDVALPALEHLRSRFDVVLAEGAGRVAARAGVAWEPSGRSWVARRAAHNCRLPDWLEAAVDVDVEALVAP